MIDPLYTDVAIVGGGITGLAAAWSLQQQDPPPNYTLLESSNRWGGKILTDELPASPEESFIIEGGPDSFITQKPWAWQLARQLGLADRLLPTNDAQRKVYVLHRGRPVSLPDGVMLIVPTKFTPFVTSPLVSPWGKMRMGLEWFVSPKLDQEDETLADFIRRRLGDEALDKIAEPLLSGIYNADAEQQSLLATFPRFRALEEKHGSLIRGMLAAKKIRRPQPSPNGQRPPSVFISFRGGMQELVQGLETQLTGECLLNAAVETVEPCAGGYMLTLQDGRRIIAKAVLLAVPAFVAANLIDPFNPPVAAGLRAIRYVSTGTISLAYKRQEFHHPLNGFGVVIPRSEKRRINAITWTSTKFDHRAPADHVMLRVFFGGSRTPEAMDLDDDDLLQMVRTELEAIMGITSTPTRHRIYRWFKANPQYDVGHLERVAEIEAALSPGLFVAGSPYRGIGIPDCVRQAQEAAQQLGDFLLTENAVLDPEW